MAENKRNTRGKKLTKKEEFAYMIQEAKDEITNETQTAIGAMGQEIKKSVVGEVQEIKKSVVGEVNEILKDTEKRLDAKVEDIVKIESPVEKIEVVESVEETKVVIDEEFLPIENDIEDTQIENIDEGCVGRLISRENHPITIGYDGGKMVISPREIKQGIVDNLIEEKIPKGITFIKDC